MCEKWRWRQIKLEVIQETRSEAGRRENKKSRERGDSEVKIKKKPEKNRATSSLSCRELQERLRRVSRIRSYEYWEESHILFLLFAPLSEPNFSSLPRLKSFSFVPHLTFKNNTAVLALTEKYLLFICQRTTVACFGKIPSLQLTGLQKKEKVCCDRELPHYS